MGDDGSDLIRNRGIGPPTATLNWRAGADTCPKEDAEMVSVAAPRRLRRLGYRGGKSAIYNVIAAVRARKWKMESRLDAMPVEFSQYEFRQVDVRHEEGELVQTSGTKMSMCSITCCKCMAPTPLPGPLPIP